MAVCLALLKTKFCILHFRVEIFIFATKFIYFWDQLSERNFRISIEFSVFMMRPNFDSEAVTKFGFWGSLDFEVVTIFIFWGTDEICILLNFPIWLPKYKISTLKHKISTLKYKISTLKYKIWTLKHKIWTLKHKISILKHKT